MKIFTTQCLLELIILLSVTEAKPRKQKNSTLDGILQEYCEDERERTTVNNGFVPYSVQKYRRREPETKSINPDELVIISCEKKCRNPATNEDLDSELYKASAITVDKSFYYHEGTITEKMTIDCICMKKVTNVGTGGKNEGKGKGGKRNRRKGKGKKRKGRGKNRKGKGGKRT